METAVLFASCSLIAYIPIFPKATGLITSRTSLTSHHPIWFIITSSPSLIISFPLRPPPSLKDLTLVSLHHLTLPALVSFLIAPYPSLRRALRPQYLIIYYYTFSLYAPVSPPRQKSPIPSPTERYYHVRRRSTKENPSEIPRRRPASGKGSTTSPLIN